MKLVCKTCNVEITKHLIELHDFNLLNNDDGEDYIPLGFYMIGYGKDNKDYPTKIIINLKDLINSKHHFDTSRLNGCCGLDGCDGINTVCINNHELGTENSDCWMPHYISLESDLIKWVED